MAFTLEANLSNAPAIALDLPQAVVALTVGLVGIDSSGYVGAAGTAPALVTLIGVVDEAVDNSGGSAGDTDIQIIVNHDMHFWNALTSDTPTQAQMHDVVSLDASSVVDENDSVTDSTGVVKLVRLIDATNKKVLTRFLRGGDLA